MTQLAHTVNTVLPSRVRASEEEHEHVHPYALADDYRMPDIAGFSVINVGQQIAMMVHGVDSAIPGRVLTGKDFGNVVQLPPIGADDHGMPDIAGFSVITIGQQLARIVIIERHGHRTGSRCAAPGNGAA